MEYIETELLFIPGDPAEETLAKNATRQEALHKTPSDLDLLGVKIRLGNQPLVYRLSDFIKPENKSVPPVSDRDHYLVVHAISATRTQGRAKVDELQYLATAVEPVNLQTVDLVPKTRFNEILNVNLSMHGALDLSGQMSLDVPEAVAGHLLSELVDIAPGIQLQLSASARFIGKLTYSIQVPVVQASGIGSDSCCWVLRPDDKKTPLLGDQLLLQSIALPVGTRRITYNISALVKADKGLFWKQQQKATPLYKIEVDLGSTSGKRDV